jgi:hypothetical protein
MYTRNAHEPDNFDTHSINSRIWAKLMVVSYKSHQFARIGVGNNCFSDPYEQWDPAASYHDYDL